MLNAKKLRKVSLAAITVLALVATLVMCLASCGGVELTKIEAKTSTWKTTYQVGEILNLTDAKITATYSDNTTADKDVTREMVQVEAFTTVGEYVAVVTYTEEGKTLTANVTITVVDTLGDYKAEKNAAVNALAGNSTNTTILSLLASCKADINAAKTTADIDTIVSQFESNVAAINAALTTAKADAVAAVNGADYSKLSDKYKAILDSNKTATLKSIELATDAESAKAFADGFLLLVEGYEDAESAVNDTNKDDPGFALQIAALVSEVQKLRDDFMANIWYSDSVKAEISKKCAETQYYLLVVDNLLMAEDAKDGFIDIIEAADTILDEVYKAAKAIGIVQYLDACDDRIEIAEVLRDKCFNIAITHYGDDSVAKEALKNYTPKGETTPVDVLAMIDTARARYIKLGEAAHAAYNGLTDGAGNVILKPVVPAIDAMPSADLIHVDSLSDIQDAYAAYLAWAKYFDIVDDSAAYTPAEDEYQPEVEKLLVDKYGVEFFRDFDYNNQPDVADDEKIYNDKDALVENYFDIFKNWNAYFAAIENSQKDIEKVIEAIKEIGEVLIGVTPEFANKYSSFYLGVHEEIEDAVEYRDSDKSILVDSEGAIENAETLYIAFITNPAYGYGIHKAEYFVINGVDYEKVLTDARTEYDTLSASVDALLRSIGLLANELEYLDLSYEPTLNAIQVAYDAFKAANVLNGTAYTGRIYNYHYYLDAVARMDQLLFAKALGEAITEFKAAVEVAMNSYPEKIVEIDEVGEEHVAVLTAITFDGSKTLDENKAAVATALTAAKAALTAVIG